MKCRAILAALTFVFAVGMVICFAGCGREAPVSPFGVDIGTPASKAQLTFVKHSGPSSAMMKIVSVSELVTMQAGGELSLEAGKDPGLLAVIHQDPPISSSLLYVSLSSESPLSPTVLQAAIERPASMFDSHLYSILSMNSPLRECVLQSLMDNAHLLASSYMYSLLLASSPLPSSILGQVGNLGLPYWYEYNIMNTQTGVRGSEYDMNAGGGGGMVSLEVIPGAVSEDAELSISLDDEELVGDVYLTFGPHGTIFDPPALLNIEASGLDLSAGDPSTIDIFYDNQNTGEWEPMPREALIVDQNEGYINVINAQLPHFSRYAVAFAN